MSDSRPVGQYDRSDFELPEGQYDGPDACDTCEGYREVCVGFGVWSNMRPGLALCPDCHGTGRGVLTAAMVDRAYEVLAAAVQGDKALVRRALEAALKEDAPDV